MIELFYSKPTTDTTESNNTRIKCFNPSKPNEMSEEIYEKFKISSKHLSEDDKKDLWIRFTEWWKNVFGLYFTPSISFIFYFC